MVVLPSSELDELFSSEQRLEPATIHDLDDEQLDNLDDLRQAMARLDPEDADILTLYFERGLDQDAIATIYGVTQGAISWRVQRAIWRLRFLLGLPIKDRQEMENVVKRCVPDWVDQEIVMGLWVTTNQSEVRRRLGIDQSTIWHVMRRIQRDLARQDDDDCRRLLATLEWVGQHKGALTLIRPGVNGLRQAVSFFS